MIIFLIPLSSGTDRPGPLMVLIIYHGLCALRRHINRRYCSLADVEFCVLPHEMCETGGGARPDDVTHQKCDAGLENHLRTRVVRSDTADNRNDEGAQCECRGYDLHLALHVFALKIPNNRLAIEKASLEEPHTLFNATRGIQRSTRDRIELRETRKVTQELSPFIPFSPHKENTELTSPDAAG